MQNFIDFLQIKCYIVLVKYQQEEKYMKKKIALVLVAVMAATALFACGKKDNGSGTAKKTAKVIDIDLTSEEYAFGVDKDQADLLE